MTTTKNELKRAKSALRCAKKLEAASEALQQYLYACLDCGERYPYADDSRITLQRNLNEFSGWLDSVYSAKLIELVRTGDG